MTMRRLASGILGLLLFLTSSVASATATQWPQAGRVIQAIVPSQAGTGIGNSVARLVFEALSERLGNRIVLQHYTSSTGFPSMPPAADTGTEGYTLLFASVDTLVIEPGLQRTATLPTHQAFEPIGLVAESPHVVVVNNDLPVHSVRELTDYISRYPGVVHFGSSGNGSSLHLAGEAYLSATGTNMVHVPYSAAEPATNNLVSGDIQAMFQVTSGVLNYVRAHKVRALAVMAPQRSPALPEIPSMAEAGYPDLTAARWYALLAPGGTPREIIEKYNAALNDALESPELRDKLLELGVTPLGGTPAQLGQFLALETRKWHATIKEAHLNR
ncbi:MAG TPA: tripartite tricarboxylate transporter substrate binding protein [Burkholderiaceae bacterium]|nr:tripartite tricarboxylate transporter substrate binding protein [bacterium SGD-2]HZH57167.1 tripartite tricarboxylate transporter substrate binding protein [Burkholderiaceae bacterium]